MLVISPSFIVTSNNSPSALPCNRLFCLLFFILYITNVNAEQGISLTDNLSDHPLELGAFFGVDKSGDITIDQLLKKNMLVPNATPSNTESSSPTQSSIPLWQPVKNSNASFGYSSFTHWIKQKITNNNQSNSSWIISYGYSLIDLLDVYYVNDGHLIQSYSTGDLLPFHERPIDSRNFLFPLELPYSKSVTVYFRLRSTSMLKAPIHIWTEKKYQREAETLTTLQGIFIGALLVMVLYNGFLFFSIRDKSYAYYIGFLFFGFLSLSEYNGFSYQFLWPNSPNWNSMSLPFSLSALNIFGCLFLKSFLNLKHTEPTHNKTTLIIIFTNTVLLITSITLDYRSIISPTLAATSLTAIYAFYLSASLWMKGTSNTRFLTFSWGALLCLGFIIFFTSSEFIHSDTFIDGAVQIFAIIQVTLLSIALGDRIHQTHDIRLDEQKILMESHIQVQHTLEERISQYTDALKSANNKLKLINTLDSLTGLKNRRYFSSYIKNEFHRAQRSQHAIAVIIIDIDNFKSINDIYGSIMGENCIIAVANTITDIIRRPTDRAARYGGKAFAIVLDNTDQNGAGYVAERIRSNVEKLTILDRDTEIRLTISIGIHCEVPHSHSAIEEAMSLSEKALQDAKDNGRNCIVFSPQSSESGTTENA